MSPDASGQGCLGHFQKQKPRKTQPRPQDRDGLCVYVNPCRVSYQMWAPRIVPHQPVQQAIRDHTDQGPGNHPTAHASHSARHTCIMGLRKGLSVRWAHSTLCF